MRHTKSKLKELQLAHAGNVTLDHKKVARLHGVRPDGSEVYLGRHEGFASMRVELEDGHVEKIVEVPVTEVE